MEADCRKCGAILTEDIQKVACGASCRECGRYAYFADEPSYLYLLTNPSLGLHKIGIGTVGKDKNRLAQLIKGGWIAHGLWHSHQKGKTFQWEKAIFKELKVVIGPETGGLVGRWDRDWVEGIGAQVISVKALELLISKVIFSQGK